ncbi:MAG: MFS transporter [Gammaproteobacteria bacterium]|nr:MAG: MFS transporter [Gammaproteobacteria bacterium]
MNRGRKRDTHDRRAIWSWALYDWGNSAFATVVLAGFYPILFREYWAADLATGQVTFWLGLGNALSSLVIVLLAPVLGAIADRGGLRKRLLGLFALLGIVMTVGLWQVEAGLWPLAWLLFLLAAVGFMGANVFYDALLSLVSPESELDRISALGYGLGYLGGGLMFLVCTLAVMYPAWFGLADARQAMRVAFLAVGLWWLVFSLPILLWVPEARHSLSLGGAVREGMAQFAGTFRHLRRYRHVMHFLLAYWLYIDGVDTIVRMAVDYGAALGLDSTELVKALLLVQFVAFPAAIVYGHLGKHVGVKPALLGGIGAYALITVWGTLIEQVWQFYAVAVAIGLVQGGVQALSRSLYARIIPADQQAEFFGFYNMLGKFAAVFGPLLLGSVAALTSSPRFSMLSLLLLFAAGGWLLARLDVEAAGRAAGRRVQ